MKQLIVILILVLLGVLLILLSHKSKSDKTIVRVLRIVSLLLFAVCFFRMIKTKDVFDAVSALDVTKVKELGAMTSGDGLVFVILRWLTMYSLLFCLLAPWFRNIRTVDNMIALFTPVIVVLNIIFLDLTFTCYLGVNGFAWTDINSVIRVVEFIAELGIMGGMSVYYLYEKITKKDWDHLGKQLLYLLLIIVLYSIFTLPESTLTNLFGPATFLKKIGLGGKKDYDYYVMKTFDVGNRLMLYSMVPIMFGMYIFLRNKRYEIRHFAVTSLALGVLLSFCYAYPLKFNVTSLPLHLCNAGVVMIFFAFAFRNKPLYYFNFLVNVIGAFVALVSCNSNGDFISAIGIHYYFSHYWLVILPCIAMALKVFPRPNLKMVKGAVLVFTIYFLAMCVINPWFNNYALSADYIEKGENPRIDYFYLMSDFLTDKFSYDDIKDNYAYALKYKNLTFWVYPVFWAAVYAVYTAAIFGIWYVYDLLFKIGDQHYDMLCRKRKIRRDLKGIDNSRRINRPNSLPLNEKETNMIKFSHFTKKYGNSKVKAVDDFSLEIHDGEVFGFIGHNGAGKSTAIKSLIGIQSITEGSIEVCGYDIAKQPLPAKKLIGYVPDNHAVYERLTGREYINYVADLYRVSRADREERLNKYLNIFKLGGDIDRQIKGYSHGMKQKIVVIAALIHEPKVWVLDEPLTGLDPTSSYQIKECMREHANKGNIVFFSSHVIEVVEKICDRIAIISKGKLQCVYSMKDLKAQGMSLEELYMQYVQKVDEEMLHSEEKKDEEKLKTKPSQSKEE